MNQTERMSRKDASIKAPFISPVSVDEAVLFAFDDEAIPFSRNLELEMKTPRKFEGNPVVAMGEDGDPDCFGVQFYGSIIHDDGKYRMWYVAMDESLLDTSKLVRGMGDRPAYAESDDGIHWRKPDLGLVEYKGSKSNNLLLIDPAPIGTINLKVLVDHEDPDPERRYKMVAQTWWLENDDRGFGTLCPLVSGDGYRWRIAADVHPVHGCFPKDEIIIPPHHFEAGGGLYRWNGIFYSAGQGAHHGARHYSGREIALHRSADFDHWSETTSLAFVRAGQYESFRGGEGEEAHEGVSVWNRGNVLLGLYGMWHGAPDWPGRTLDLGLLVSNDGLKFREPVTEWVFLERGADGEWDQGGLLQGQGFENVGDKTYVYYGAWDPRCFEPYEPRGGLGLATLERDRFGGLSPRTDKTDGDDALLITEAISCKGRLRIEVNVDGLGDRLGDGAALEVELLDEHERPIAGYSGADSSVVRRSGYRVPATWKSGATVECNPEAPIKVCVRFTGDDKAKSSLYAIYLVRDE